MQAFTKYIRVLSAVALLLLMRLPAFAGDEHYAAEPLDGNKGQVKKDSTTTVRDTVTLNPTYASTAYNIRNVVTFSINEYSLMKLPDAFKAKVTVKIYATRYDGSNYVMDSSVTTDLYVNYDKNNHYSLRAAYAFGGACQVKIKILDITAEIGTLSDFDSVLMLENEIQVNRAYAFDCSNSAVQAISKDTSDVSGSGELKVSWAKERTADEYDLEWTFVDDSAKANYLTSGNPDPKKIFPRNATRVSVTGEDYTIPLLYDNSGTLYFRVRSVQVDNSGQRKEAHWSSDYSGGLGAYAFNGHERTLNWQATTSYAEEGKRKSVVQYYDGSLRSRQTVTKDNTTDTTLVAETMYDYQGRPVIQVLPAPSLSRLIGYTPNFSVDVNNAEYDKTKYDGPASTFNYCGPSATQMGTQSGASKYYSPANQNAGNGFHQYIPDAHGYPFTETKYTQDNTGRISAQGGVGPKFQIGMIDSATGLTHETKYYYGSADQEDIDALFGTEAGNANHYFKNMVRDANGQYSVSYVDMHGRTVATALAGKPFTQMDSLESGRLLYVTKKLVDSTNNIVKGLVIEASKSLVVTKAGAHVFHYSLAADSLQLKACDSSQVCYDCLYNLQITISDDCNNQTLPGGVPMVIADSNFTIGHITSACDSVAGFNKTFTDTLQEGTYTITKRLTVSKYGMDYYRDSIFLVRNTCRSLSDFIVEQQQLLLSRMDCMPTCAHCSIDTFSSWTLYRPWYLDQMGIATSDTAAYRNRALTAYNQQRAACDEVCGTTLLSTTIRDQMLADMTPPYGQYANPDNVDGYSIFSNNPVKGGYEYQLPGYTDENGSPDVVYLSNGTAVSPAGLGITDFVRDFKSGWADSLLRFHPEYCKLQLYSSPAFAASQAWDSRFEAVDTYKQAVDSGWLNPLGYTDAPVGASSTIRDPFFNSSINPAYAGTWRGVLNDSMRSKAPKMPSGFVDMWSTATMMAQCSSGDNACQLYYGDNTHPFDIDTSCGGTLDLAWRYFREMYQAKKQEILGKILNSYCTVPATDLSGGGHVLNFPDQGMLQSQLPSGPAAGADSLASMISSSCEGYVKQWWQDLGPCNYLPADSLVLMPRLIRVCEEGGDDTHPFGSSSANPASTYTYKTFDDVLKAYNDSLALLSTPRIISRTQCNGYLIAAPAPYDNRPSYGNVEIWAKPDSCQCSTITALYNQYLSYGLSDANFSAFLLRTTGASMSGAALDSLRQLCNGEITCVALKTPISLPPALQCGVHDVCVSCQQVNDVYTQYTTAFPAATPAFDNSDSLQRSYNHLFESFMNNKLGFGMQASDYLTFMDTCRIFNANPVLTSCDSLENLKSDFIRYGGRIRKLDASGGDTAFYKLDFGGRYYNIGIPMGEVIKDGVVHLPSYYADTITTHARLDFDHFLMDTLCVDTAGFTFETRLKLPDSAIISNFYDASWWLYVYTPQPSGDIQLAASAVDHKGVAVCTHSGSTDPLKACADDDVPGQHFNDWRVLKLKLRGRQLYYYLDDSLMAQRTMTDPVSKITGWSVSAWSMHGYIDYIRIYDTAGRMYYNEDFNDVTNLSYPTSLTNCAPCEDRFTSYFNQLHSTSYSYTQIDSIYYNTCDKHLGNVCDPLYCNTALLFNRGKRQNVRVNPVNTRLNLDSSQFTLETTIKPVPGKYYILVGNRTQVSGPFSDGFFWLILNSGEQLLQIQGCPNYITNNTTGVSLYDGKPHHIAVVKYNDSLRFYIDGTSIPYYVSHCGSGEPTTPLSARNINSSGPIIMGMDSLDNTAAVFAPSYISGWMSEMRIWKIARTPDQIRQYGNEQLSPQTGLVGYYLMRSTDTLSQIIVDISTGLDNLRNNAILGTSVAKDSQDPSWVSSLQVYNNSPADSLRPATSYCDCNTNMPMLCGRSQPVFPPVALLSHNSCDDSTNIATTVGTLRFHAYSDSLNGTFDDKYMAKCLNAYKLESFTVTQPMSEFHYTLYYYDQAGNLAKTVPPSGVDMSVFSRSTYFDSVRAARQNGTVYVPSHTLATEYRYNTLNQVVVQHTPDAGTSHFWYDRLGRLVVSQNAKQYAVSGSENNRQYSYTKYDYLGRIDEVGQVNNLGSGAVAMTNAISRSQGLLKQWLDTTLSGRNEQITRTFYDLPYAGSDIIPMSQRNLRNRVSYTSYSNTSIPAYNQATFYSYDIHGNVDTLLQDYGNGSASSDVWNIMNKNGNRWKRVQYDYDLISGKVNMVSYQPRYWDAVAGQYITPYDCFYHRYTYDAENRLTLVETSGDSVLWEKDARYEYYKHGPLARTVLGDQQVQGLDYAYTLQGWLKGVNGNSLRPVYDMGSDGLAGGQRNNIARDVFAYSLNYFTGDYSGIGGNTTIFPGYSAYLNGASHDLYNGNISSMLSNIRQFAEPTLFSYKYDQLNRIKNVDVWLGFNEDSSHFHNLAYTQAWTERFKYDGNGNILHADRYTGIASSPMDSMDYHYQAGTNKLTHISEASSSYSWIEGTKDIEDQPVNNYGYDAIGNLIRDSSENIGTDGITWNVYGKITSITHSAATATSNMKRIEYTYDAAGNRIGQKLTKFSDSHVWYTWYVRDAQGNVLDVYTASKDTSTSPTLADFDLLLTESHLYGSSRLGLIYRNLYAEPPSPQGQYYGYSRGYKFYEITNHLGNVVTTISDKKLGVLDSSTSMIRYAYYNPEIVTANDYFVFGMERKHYDAGIYFYRYGFNGKEDDRDVKGDGEQLDYGMRIYDPRVGRFYSMDPLMTKYPWYTPYQFAGNKPTVFIDRDGLEEAYLPYFWQHKEQMMWENAKTPEEKQRVHEMDMQGMKIAGLMVGGSFAAAYGLEAGGASLLRLMLKGGVTGAATNTAISIMKGDKTYEIFKSATSGFLSGAVLGAFGETESLRELAIAGGVSGVVGEFANQSIDVMFEDNKKYSLSELATSGILGSAANVFAAKLVKYAREQIDQKFEKTIEDIKSATYQKMLKKSIRDQNPRIAPKILKQEVKKTTAEIIRGVQKSQKQAEIAAQKTIEAGMDQAKEKIQKILTQGKE